MKFKPKFVIPVFAVLLTAAALYISPLGAAGQAVTVQSALAEEMLPVPTFYISISADGEQNIQAVPVGTTVQGAIDIFGVGLSEDDIVTADLNSAVCPGQHIKIDRVNYSVYPEHEQLDFETVEQDSDSLFKGETETAQAGSAGGKEITYRDKYVNGQRVSHEKISEKIITYPTDEIILHGTKSIEVVEDEYTGDSTSDDESSVEVLEVTDETTDSDVLLKTANDYESFSLPKVNLSDEDREWLERIVTGEFGGSYIGSCLIAQSIKCAIVYDGYTSVKDVISGMGYVGSTSSISTNAVNAVKYIFDENNLAVRHRLFYMCTEDYYDAYPGNFHSTQNFILQYENVKFFDRW